MHHAAYLMHCGRPVSLQVARQLHDRGACPLMCAGQRPQVYPMFYRAESRPFPAEPRSARAPIPALDGIWGMHYHSSI